MAIKEYIAFLIIYSTIAQMKKRRKVLMLLSTYDPVTHRGIARAALSQGWYLNVSALNPLQVPQDWNGDGIICSLNENKRIEDFVVRAGLPCVDLSAWRTDLGFPRVCADDARIGQLAAEHFSMHGHSAFGWFSHLQNPVSKARFQSYRQELLERRHSSPARFTGKQVQNQQAVTAWLRGLEKPCALFAYHDVDAAWLLNCCTEAGFRVPEDFAIMGVDDNPLICEHQSPPLSSIKHDHERIGYEGALLLARMMDGPMPATRYQTIAPTGISLRASSDSLATKDSLVQAAVNFMTKHLSKPIGTSEIAAEIGIGRRNLELRFRAALKCSVHRKLVELRLKQAEWLLCSTEEKVEHIAAVTGFSHSPHLCRVFKSAYGRTPRAYRNEQSTRLRNL